MKRLLALMLAVSMIVLICGCEKQPQTGNSFEPTQNTQQSTGETTIPSDTVETSQKPMYAISLPPVEQAEKADDGTVIFRCAYQNISLILPEQEVADKIIVDFLGRTDNLVQHADDALDTAKQAYASGGEWNPHLLQLKYSPERLDAGILSLRGEKRSYTGGAHTAYSGESVTYDLLTGKALYLIDIMHDTVTVNSILQLITDALADRIENDSITLFTTYEETLKQLLGSDLSNYEDWYLSANGLIFYFDPYEIAPFSEGTVTAEIPYDQLTGILKDAYFPAEEDLTNGIVNATLFEDASTDNFTQFSEIVLEEGTTKFLLYADGAVSDITIAAGPIADLSVDSARWDSTVFAAHTLTPGDAIMVEADFTTTALLVGYRTGDQYCVRSIIMDDNGIRIE